MKDVQTLVQQGLLQLQQGRTGFDAEFFSEDVPGLALWSWSRPCCTSVWTSFTERPGRPPRPPREPGWPPP
ncbi:hypothetical protein [Streptomyces echinatus]|uniref:hypothetical protein n=1 Tax=Streptomyces echinatus TaxID=67293 RepID=UPI0031E9676F